MRARAALSSRSSPSLLVALLLPSLSFLASAQLSNKRLSLSHRYPPRREEEEERSLIEDVKRHTQLTVAWSRHGSLVPRRT